MRPVGREEKEKRGRSKAGSGAGFPEGPSVCDSTTAAEVVGLAIGFGGLDGRAGGGKADLAHRGVGGVNCCSMFAASAGGVEKHFTLARSVNAGGTSSSTMGVTPACPWPSQRSNQAYSDCRRAGVSA